MTPRTARTITLFIVALCLLVQFKAAGGWATIPGLVLWPVVGLLHYLSHSRAIPRTGNVAGSLLALMGTSHVLFICGFLLQYDVGDGPGWLTITSLFNR